ncbi:TetR/AcrR family transcriptional regulator [Arthrobacter sp. YD2]|uniref:TetR/AcrR family transcriptional regulator n=1 Tax=Arthrobacter sp. YD2 TaxID=3058046 RepID=UPI0025B401AC|nr:TetR/AcrR family transcriptional regulator [Arthrobacter sp. YD2]MDN3903189.1 TetR/AcrR family transcriptional regulator [Arthrobacter sp. YD2]
MASPQDTQTRLLDSAEKLFFQNGIAVSGVDSVAADAGVSVVTLYKHFKSKDNLLREVLARRLSDWTGHWDAAIAAAPSPADRLLAVFDAVETFRAASGPTQWCCFLATASERPIPAVGASDPVQALLETDSRLVSERLGELARAAGCRQPAATASALLLIYNGVLASLLRGLPADPIVSARAAARALLRAEA